jgi:hypothetical protein
MQLKLPQWLSAIGCMPARAKLSLGSIPRVNVADWLQTATSELKKTLSSFVSQIPTLLVGGFFFEFLEPGSLLFFMAAALTLALFVLVKLRRRRLAMLALVSLLGFAPVLSLSANYYIASDQARLRYRTSEGASYIEFPSHVSFLSSMVSKYAEDIMINVVTCGDVKVARLTLLPYRPLYADRDLIISPFGFRRLPEIKFERVELSVNATSGAVLLPNGKQKRSLGASVGFSPPDTATLPITKVLPRSILCLDNRVPLLPIFEVLPWNPDDTRALIKAVTRIGHFREAYPDSTISLDRLLQLRMGDSDGAYKSLLDFFIYSIAYHTFSGNVFAEVRADIGNQLCVIAENRPEAFSGPFNSLPQNFLRQIIAEAGARHQLAYPACHVPEGLLERYQTPPTADPFPFFSTFRTCIENATEIATCLQQDDAPRPETKCDPSCSIPTGQTDFSEELFQLYDEKFLAVASTAGNQLVGIKTIKPEECPTLRDTQEQRQFIYWWRVQSTAILTEPFMCSSPQWLSKLAESHAMAKSVISCAKHLNIQDEAILGTNDTLDYWYEFRCHQSADLKKLANDLDEASAILDNLPLLIAKMKSYSELIGRRRLDAMVRAFEMFVGIKQAACGSSSAKFCIKTYASSGALQELANRVRLILGAPLFEGTEMQIIQNLAKLDNMVIDMGICDLLQDEDLRKRTGYSREAYCDDHGLEAYRVIGSNSLGHLIERASEGGISYSYQSNGPNQDSTSIIKLPVGR